MDMVTHEFCKFLAAHNLFAPLNMRVRQNDKIKNISGCYVINEDRLNNLSDDLFAEVRKKRYLSPIYAQMISLAQIERLVSLKDEQAAKASLEKPKAAPAIEAPAEKPASTRKAATAKQ